MARSVSPWLLLGLIGAAGLWAASRTRGGQEVGARVVEAIMSGIPRGIRNNNPGNIERTAERWRGMADDQSGDPRFIVFAAPVWGLRALARVLRNYQARGLVTVRQMVNAWAPPTENVTSAYVDAVAEAIGVPPDEPVDLDVALPAFMAAIVKHENGQQPYAPAMFEEAIRLERAA